MLKTLTENRLQGQLRAVLDYVVSMKEPVVIARDEGNAVIVPQEIYEAAEEYLHRHSMQAAMPRAIPQFGQDAFSEQPDSENGRPIPDRPDRTPGRAIDSEAYSPNPMQQSEPAFEKMTRPGEPAKQSAQPIKQQDTSSDPFDGMNLREVVAARIAQQLQANHIDMSDEAFSKLVDETLQEIESSGDMSFLQDLDRENAAMQADARKKQMNRPEHRNDDDDELYHFGRN